MNNDARKEKISEKGQALFEFIVFLPMILILFSFVISIGNSINGSINQQKSLRGYYFYLLKGNTRAPIKRDLTTIDAANIGMSALGWRAREESNEPVSSCYKLSSFFGELNPGETCEDPQVTEGISQFIRVYTGFGICSENYSQVTAGEYHQQLFPITTGSCRNQ